MPRRLAAGLSRTDELEGPCHPQVVHKTPPTAHLQHVSWLGMDYAAQVCSLCRICEDIHTASVEGPSLEKLFDSQQGTIAHSLDVIEHLSIKALNTDRCPFE